MNKNVTSLPSIKPLVSIVIITIITALPVSRTQADFDFQTGNAAIEVVIPAIVPIVYQQVSPSGGDATLVLRITTLVTNAWYDATAPYHATAVGVYSHLGRRPENEATHEQINVALVYASYQVLNHLLPEFSSRWRAMMMDVGLDPDDTRTDITTAIGLGNVAGLAVAMGRANDGMNQLGNEGQKAHQQPYSDYTGFQPLNTAYRLSRPSKWQPDIQRQGLGLYKVQQFVTPQYALVEPYSYATPQHFRMPRPFRSNVKHRKAYVAQARQVLRASASLTQTQKLKAELFDNKIVSLGLSAVHAALTQNLTLLEFIQLDFLTNMAAFDAGIFVWQEKRKHNAVRPFSAIRYLYRDRWVTAWGGSGRGAIEMPARDWKSYLEEADHPEYPSASACFCQAHAQSARLFLGNDVLDYPVVYPAGSSRIEPGVTPSTDTTLLFGTWTELAEDCGQSRLWAGVHFQSAIDESMDFCPLFGDLAFEYMSSLVGGTAELRRPSVGRSRSIYK